MTKSYKMFSAAVLSLMLVAHAIGSPLLSEGHTYLSASDKSPLKILFVGHDPENPRVPFPDIASESMIELYKERTASFKKFLNRRFSDVKVVFGSDYKQEMSNAYDVTVFDCRPKAITAAVHSEEKFEPAVYLSRDFDKPALLIGENSPLIGEGIGLKLDWL